MLQAVKEIHYDVVVVGGGSAGVAAAIASAKNGAKTLLLESGSVLGGDLLSGIPIDGCINARGEWIVGGVAKELFEECKKWGGYVGSFSDRRSLWVVTLDPEIMGFVIIGTLSRYKVSMLLYSYAENVVVENGVIKGIIVVNKNGRTIVSGDIIIDCTGDGDMAAAAGAPFEMGGPNGELQPVSMVFRMSNVDSEKLLAFVRDYPENFSLAEHPIIDRTIHECAKELYEQGFPKAFLKAKGPLLSSAIASGEMYPCAMVAMTPTSIKRKEVSINSTRISGVNALKTEDLSSSLAILTEQVGLCVRFLNNKLPGFEDAILSGMAPRLGVRETRRIMGDYILNRDDVLNARKFEDGIAKGGHHLDVHGSGTEQVLAEIKEGGSYDIPYGCLLPQNLKNVLVAGRCMSATREANGSARVMGTCMATGQAAGTSAAMSAATKKTLRQIDVQELRQVLKQQGAVLEGTY